MNTVAEHYASHLAPIYLWMAGGFDAAIARGQQELEAVLNSQENPQARASSSDGVAVDLGAGFGMHAIPLAQRGYSVLAIDASATLLAQLRDRVGELPIRVIESDLLAFREHLDAPASLILCMGDTLTHLPHQHSIEGLFTSAAETLRPGGLLIISFRDYTLELIGDARFLPVRSDPDRIFTCFLEYAPESVTVHDLLHERTEQGWKQGLSSYRKLRISPDWVMGCLEANGFSVHREPGLSGMVRIVAVKG